MSTTPLIASASMPAWNASQRAWCAWKPVSGSTWRRARASGLDAATSSMSTPPMAESITSGCLAPRSKVTDA